MADVLIRGLEMPKNGERTTITVYGDGVWCVHYNNEPHGKAIPIPEKHGELIDRKRLDLVPDYKDVRNGIKRIIKETKRDGKAIAGISIELLVQTLVALDELRSVRRYFENAETIVPVECGADMKETGR